jgi:hypothetical protein
MPKIEISDLQDCNDLWVELSDESAEQVTGGGFITNALSSLINWIGASNDGSIEGSLESTGRAIIAAPLVGGLAVWSSAEQKLTGH